MSKPNARRPLAQDDSTFDADRLRHIFRIRMLADAAAKLLEEVEENWLQGDDGLYRVTAAQCALQEAMRALDKAEPCLDQLLNGGATTQPAQA